MSNNLKNVSDKDNEMNKNVSFKDLKQRDDKLSKELLEYYKKHFNME